MIEVYLFLGILAVQILLNSILIPRRLLQLVQRSLAHTPPDPAGVEAVQRALGRFRVANIVVAVIGLVLMGWFFFYMQRGDWTAGRIEVLMTPYFLLQYAPFFVMSLVSARINKMLKNSLVGVKRTAVLQRRGLFDFISPVVIILALLCYLLFVALAFYVARDPFMGFGGAWTNIGIVTLLYAGMALVVRHVMYGKKSSPLQTHAEHMHQIGMVVKVMVYTSISAAVFVMTVLALGMFDQKRLEPLALGTYFVLLALWVYKSMYTRPAAATTDALHTGTIQ